MAKIVALVALLVSAGAFLFESHAMIWLVLVVAPGALAVLHRPGSPRHRSATPKAKACFPDSSDRAAAHGEGDGPSVGDRRPATRPGSR